MKKEIESGYWKTNVRYLIILCSLAFFFSLVCPILLVDQLNSIQVGGIPLGFWLSTQGVYIFIVVLLIIYVRLMNNLDKKYALDE